LSQLLALFVVRMAGAAQDPTTFERQVSAALELWRGDDPKARLQALQRLGRLGSRAVAAVPALVVGLSDRDRNVRKETAGVLRSIGLAARPAVPAL